MNDGIEKAVISRADAIKQGLKYYFTGMPCKRGHLVERPVSDCRCPQCCRDGLKRWRTENKERYSSNEKRWRAENKERISAINRARYKKNPEYFIEHTRRHYRANAEEVKRKRREYHYASYLYPEVRKKAANRTREWSNNNPEAVKANARNGKAKRKGVAGKHSANDIADIHSLQRGKCALCRCTLKKYHIDHVVPVSRGGTNDRQNLQLLCAPCNLAKGARDPIFHAQTLGLLL